MKKYDLHAKIRRAFVATTDSKHSHRVYPNLLPSRTVRGLNEVWTADLTYIRIGNGFVYLAIVLDLYLRRVIGWNISNFALPAAAGAGGGAVNGAIGYGGNAGLVILSYCGTSCPL